MTKITSVTSADYDAETNSLKAKLKDKSGKELDFEIDGLAFVELMGLANIKNAVARHHRTGRELPLIPAAGIQIGVAKHGTPPEYGLGLTLIVPNIGILHFFLPREVEKALREKMKTTQH